MSAMPPIPPVEIIPDVPCVCDNCPDVCECATCECQDCTCETCSHSA
ncbi:MAG: hypothetical protein ABIZ07_13645 [Dermatophilaceae bacterium]